MKKFALAVLMAVLTAPAFAKKFDVFTDGADIYVRSCTTSGCMNT